VEGFSSDFSEYHVFEVEEGAGGVCDQEATIVGVLLTHAAQQAWTVVRQFERLIAESGSEDGAVAFCQMAQLSVGPGNLPEKVVVNER